MIANDAEKAEFSAFLDPHADLRPHLPLLQITKEYR
jgi:hypothetical protein